MPFEFATRRRTTGDALKGGGARRMRDDLIEWQWFEPNGKYQRFCGVGIYETDIPYIRLLVNRLKKDETVGTFVDSLDVLTEDTLVIDVADIWDEFSDLTENSTGEELLNLMQSHIRPEATKTQLLNFIRGRQKEVRQEPCYSLLALIQGLADDGTATEELKKILKEFSAQKIMYIGVTQKLLALEPNAIAQDLTAAFNTEVFSKTTTKVQVVGNFWELLGDYPKQRDILAAVVTGLNDVPVEQPILANIGEQVATFNKLYAAGERLQALTAKSKTTDLIDVFS